MQQKENEKYEQERSENINKNAESLGIKQEQDLNVLRARLSRIYDLLVSKKDKALETLNNKYKNKKQELVGIQTRQMNISTNVNADRAWEGSNKLTKMALSHKRDSNIEISEKEKTVREPEPEPGPFKEEKRKADKNNKIRKGKK